MITTLNVRHHQYSTQKSFEEVVSAFEQVVGTVEDVGWPSISAASKDVRDFELRVTEKLGSSGFTRFLTLDHGGWLALFGRPAKFRVYTIGNPLIAITMIEHDIEAGLNVPLRLAIYRDEASNETRLVFDAPSTLMSRQKNRRLHRPPRRSMPNWWRLRNR
jgi:uncharacterized protein (DUF302 family)